MRRSLFKLILWIVSIGLTVGVTYAYFSSQVTSSGNVITTGTLKFGEELTAQWSAEELKPGESVEGNYPLDNSGTIDAEHLEIETTNSGGAGDLQEVLEVEKMLYGYDSNNDGDVSDETSGSGHVVDIIKVIKDKSQGSDPVYNLSLEGGGDVWDLDANNDGRVTLEELAGGVIEVRGGTRDDGLGAGSNAAFYAKIKLPEDVSDSYQGKSNTLEWKYTLNQVASQ